MLNVLRFKIVAVPCFANLPIKHFNLLNNKDNYVCTKTVSFFWTACLLLPGLYLMMCLSIAVWTTLDVKG